jgi:hypothetical protein
MFWDGSRSRVAHRQIWAEHTKGGVLWTGSTPPPSLSLSRKMLSLDVSPLACHCLYLSKSCQKTMLPVMHSNTKIKSTWQPEFSMKVSINCASSILGFLTMWIQSTQIPFGYEKENSFCIHYLFHLIYMNILLTILPWDGAGKATGYR